MEKRTVAYLGISAITIWLFALAFGSANGKGVFASTKPLLESESGESSALCTKAPDMAQAPLATPVPTQAASAMAVELLDENGRPVTVVQIQAAESASANIAVDAPETVTPAMPAMPQLELACQAAILMDQTTGTVLYESQADAQRPIASITKVMTLLLTFEALHDGKIALEDTVPVSAHAYEMGGSQIWLEPGELFTLEELLKAICVSSANDAAVAVAEYVGGSEPVFVEMMNTRAAELGMTNTVYQNACGLDEENHLSSARDVAILSREILQTCPEVLNYTGIWSDTLRNGETSLTNTNKLLKHYNGITGLKTGTTGGAGICISASATRDNLSLIAVVLGSSSSLDRFNAATTMLDYGFATYEAVIVPDSASCPQMRTVKGGVKAEITLDYTALPTQLLLAKGQAEDVQLVPSLAEEYAAPIVKGAQMGTAKLYSGETVLGEYPITAAESIDALTRMGAIRALWDSLYQCR